MCTYCCRSRYSSNWRPSRAWAYSNKVCPVKSHHSKECCWGCQFCRIIVPASSWTKDTQRFKSGRGDKWLITAVFSGRLAGDFFLPPQVWSIKARQTAVTLFQIGILVKIVVMEVNSRECTSLPANTGIYYNQWTPPLNLISPWRISFVKNFKTGKEEPYTEDTTDLRLSQT